MSNTLVIQSHRSPLPYSWLDLCLESVRCWCELNRFVYRFLGDDLYDFLPEKAREKVVHQKVIASDLARLRVIQDALSKGYETVVWLDADFLIFDPVKFILPDESYAVGREVWVQHDKQCKLKVYKKVHNAFLMFRSGNSFLEFYMETAERLLRQNQGGMPPQFIGPKLLTALHNITQLPVMESAGMLSPLVVKDVVAGRGEALQLFVGHSTQPVSGANLCISSRAREEVTCDEMEQVIAALMEGGEIF
ncbi:hypothetical protein [Kaarinaea lacus]